MATAATRKTHGTHRTVKPGRYIDALEQILPIKTGHA